MERAERERKVAEDKARKLQEEIEIQSIAARSKESKEMTKARRELEEHTRKEALAREKAEKEKQAEEDRARRQEEELETKLLAARGKEERELIKARKELEVSVVLKAVLGWWMAWLQVSASMRCRAFNPNVAPVHWL